VDYLYSLYDALVSIHVPNDKARAVVDAMERDMGTTIATKSDLDVLRTSMKTEIELLRVSMKADLQTLRQELLTTMASRSELADVKSDIGVLRQDFAVLRKDVELLGSRMIIQLGSVLIVGFGLTIGTLKFVLA
jgi:hypothetical protein